MVLFSAHLSIAIKRLIIIYKQKVVLAVTLALQHGGQYKSYYFVEKSKCHKISPLNAFPLKFQLYDNFQALLNFWHQQDSNSLFQLRKHWSRELFKCKWPISSLLITTLCNNRPLHVYNTTVISFMFFASV